MEHRIIFSGVLFLLTISAIHAQQLPQGIHDYLSANDKVSSIALKAEIRTEDIAKMIRERINSPAMEGSTPELGFLLHSNETMTRERLTKVLVTPARGAYDEIKRIPRTITQTVKIGEKTIQCIGRVIRGKTCKEDILKEIRQIVYDEVKVRVPAAEAVYQDVMIPVVELSQALIPIRGKFDYKVFLMELNIHMDNNRYTVVGLFDIIIKTNVSVAHFPESIKPRGSFNNRFRIRITESGAVQLHPDGSVKTTGSGSKMEFVELFGSEFVVNSIKTGAQSTSVTEYFMDYTGDEINKKLSKTIQKTLDEELGRFNLKSFAQNLMKDLDKAIQLNQNAYFYPNVTGLFIAQPLGQTIQKTNLLTVGFAVTFQPFITFEAKPAALILKNDLIHFGTEIKTSDGLDISLPGFMSYDYVADQLIPYINQINLENENKFLIRNYLAANPATSWQENGQLNMTVDLIRKKDNKNIGHISLNTALTANTPDTSVCTRISKISVKTTDFRIFLIKGILKKTLVREAERKGCISFAKEIRETVKDLDDKLFIKTPLGDIAGLTHALTIDEIRVESQHILLRLNLVGSLKFFRKE